MGSPVAGVGKPKEQEQEEQEEAHLESNPGTACLLACLLRAQQVNLHLLCVTSHLHMLRDATYTPRSSTLWVCTYMCTHTSM